MATRYKILIGVIMILLIGLIMLDVFYSEPSQKDINKEVVNVIIDSEELTSSFKKNEVFATSIYAEKIIEVKGKVEKVSMINERVTVILKGNEDSTSIICDFSDLYQEEALGLHEGETIRIKGICKGFLKDVIVLNCKIVNP